MKSIAFIFTNGPYGNTSSSEGLDLLLAISSLSKSNKIGVFFISDGVLLLLSKQQPAKILAKNFTVKFSILSIYDINQIYMCADSAMERGLNSNIEYILDFEFLSAKYLRHYLSKYNVILTF
ncbi:Protein TusC [secondary endosymbiont of Trabutina mannipara]|uniref:Protein TusC n=1 Tax=secondary endosymbiont of Trabutina mannipara TaxID=1835721 RepID=A0A1C3L3M7_9ENTR|nr:sulfurtransferase complex subunit TusC [secondary endosymbiont of Trabutina mannipara]SBT81888.1 Protein TusC [secondary endosymbiont of Trabutina mannipara]